MRIVLGITGSVATVLTPKLIGQLLDSGHEVKVVATTPALYFLPPSAYKQYLARCDWELDISGRVVKLFKDKDEWPVGGYHKNDPVRHIEFRDWADVLLIAPLTANTLTKLALGICDNFLSCIAYAWPKEKSLVIAPAMNTEMWVNPLTAKHLADLQAVFRSVRIVDPIEKKLACGDVGQGAMAKIETIVAVVNSLSI